MDINIDDPGFLCAVLPRVMRISVCKLYDAEGNLMIEDDRQRNRLQLHDQHHADDWQLLRLASQA